LKQVGGGIAVSTERQGVEVIIDLVKDTTKLNHAGSCARNYIREHAGATSTIMDKSASYLAQKTRTSL